MKTLLLMLLLTSTPAEERRQACAGVDSWVASHRERLTRAKESRDRAAVAWLDARRKKLPPKPTQAQVKALSDELLSTSAALQEAESQVRQAQDSLDVVRTLAAEERQTLGCPTGRPG